MAQPLRVPDAPTDAGMAAPLDGIMLAQYSHRVADDMAAAIAALEAHRSHAREVAAVTALDAAIGRLRGAGNVQRLLARPQAPEVSLADALYDLTVALEGYQRRGRPVQLSFSLEPIVVDGDFAWRLSAVAAEVVSNALRHGLQGSSGNIAVTLGRERHGIACRIKTDGGGDGWPRPTGAGPGGGIIDGIVAFLKGEIERTCSRDGTGVSVWLPEPRRKPAIAGAA